MAFITQGEKPQWKIISQRLSQRLSRRLTQWGVAAVDRLLPPRCLTCGVGTQNTGRICAECWKKLTFLQGSSCVCCGHPFEFQAADSLCGACQKSTPPFDRARAALRYDEGSRRMIIPFKHGDRTDYTDLFAKMLYQACPDMGNMDALVVPVPLHKKRLGKRRYNQAALMAQNFAHKTGFDYVPDMMLREKYTPPQEGNYSQRKRNVSGVFSVKEGHKQILKERKIILIDDVYTTGATVWSCARILKKAGAVGVDVLTVARVCH